MWELRAVREGSVPIEEQYARQGTAYRRARLLHAAGYEVTAVQFSVEDPPVPLFAFRFDGIRFVKASRFPRR